MQASAEEPTLRTVELLHRARQGGTPAEERGLCPGADHAHARRWRRSSDSKGCRANSRSTISATCACAIRTGPREVVRFFASRLKYSRWAEVTVVADQQVEALVRALVDHVAAFGGIPLVAVFDRPKTVALKWGRDGVVTEWNATFAVALDLGSRRRSLLVFERVIRWRGCARRHVP